MFDGLRDERKDILAYAALIWMLMNDVAYLKVKSF